MYILSTQQSEFSRSSEAHVFSFQVVFSKLMPLRTGYSSNFSTPQVKASLILLSGSPVL